MRLNCSYKTRQRRKSALVVSPYFNFEIKMLQKKNNDEDLFQEVDRTSESEIVNIKKGSWDYFVRKGSMHEAKTAKGKMRQTTTNKGVRDLEIVTQNICSMLYTKKISFNQVKGPFLKKALKTVVGNFYLHYIMRIKWHAWGRRTELTW